MSSTLLMTVYLKLLTYRFLISFLSCKVSISCLKSIIFKMKEIKMPNFQIYGTYLSVSEVFKILEMPIFRSS